MMNFKNFFKVTVLLSVLFIKINLTATELTITDYEHFEMAVFNGRNNLITSVAFSPDGKTLAFGLYNERSGKIELWDAEAKSEKQFKNYIVSKFGSISSLAFSPDGKLIALRSLNGTVELWDVTERSDRTGRKIETCFSEKYKHNISSVTFSPSGSLIAGGFSAGEIILWDVKSDHLIQEIHAHRGGVVISIAVSPNGKFIVAGYSDGIITLWDMEENRLKWQFSGNSGRILSVAFSPDGRLIASGDFGGTIRLFGVDRLFDEKTMGVVREFHNPDSNVICLAFSPDGKVVASGHADYSVRLWKIAENKLIHKFSDNNYPILSVAFSPDGTKLAAAGGVLIIWTDKLAVKARQEWQKTDNFSLTTLATAMHPRLGEASPAQILIPDVLRWISELFIITPWIDVFEK